LVNLDNFSLVYTGNTVTRPYSFVNLQGKNLVVTMGDSWTWGSDMTLDDNHEHRLQNHFGQRLAQEWSADWLNIAQGGSGNFWLYDRVEELAKVIPTLDYQHIYVVCTLTEIGRAVQARTDIDFYNFFVENDIKDFLFFLNNLCAEKIIQYLQPFDNVTLKIGTNFVNYLGNPYNVLLPRTWLELMCEHCGVDYSGICHVVSPWALGELRALIDLVPEHKHNDYLSMLNELVDSALQRERLLRSLPITRNLHPTAPGHGIWANYILQNI
jgi:hypothetical protein